MIIEITSTICYSCLATSSIFLAPSVLLKLFLCRKIGTFYTLRIIALKTKAQEDKNVLKQLIC